MSKNNDRFTDYDDEVKQLVLDFERTVLNGGSQFFDVDELTTIIDYYFDVEDNEPLVSAIVYAEQLYPDSTEIKLCRVHWYIINKKYDKAQDLLLALEAQHPDDCDVAYAFGVLCSEQKQHERALAYFKKAATDTWQVAGVYACIAEEYYYLKDYAEAFRYYKKTLAEDPEDTDSLYNLIDVCDRGNLVDDAVRFLRDFVEQHPYSKEGWYCLGVAYRYMSLDEQAADALQYAIAIDKDYTLASLELARLQEDMGDVGDAATTLVHLLDSANSRADVFRSLGQLYMRQDNAETAMSYLRKALAENEHDSDAMAMLGLCHLRQDDLTMAITMAKRALAIDPDSTDALCCMALTYDKKGNREAACDYFERLLATEDYTESHCRTYVVFLFNNDLYDTLIDFALESLEIYPHDAFYSTYLAAAYYMSNRYNSMRRVLDDVDASLLFELCPAIWDNPRIIPFLPKIHLT